MGKIKVNNNNLYRICLWNNEHLFVGCLEKTIKMVGIQNNIVVKSLKGLEALVIPITKIYHPKYGECSISQGKEKIKLGSIKLIILNIKIKNNFKKYKKLNNESNN